MRVQSWPLPAGCCSKTKCRTCLLVFVSSVYGSRHVNQLGMSRQTGLERSAAIRTSGMAASVKFLFRTSGTEFLKHDKKIQMILPRTRSTDLFLYKVRGIDGTGPACRDLEQSGTILERCGTRSGTGPDRNVPN